MSQKQFVAFMLNEEEFVLPIEQVQEIVSMQPLTAVPQGEGQIEGIINLRGVIIPVVDLKKRFFSVYDADNRKGFMIVVKLRKQLVCIISDSVSEVISLEDTQISEPSPLLRSSIRSGIYGVGKLEDKLVLLLDLDSVFSDSELELFEGVAN